MFGAFALSDVHRDSKTGQTAPFFFDAVTSTSGREMYLAYCSGCHGKDGRARTPASRLCAVSPSDLTLLSINNQGSYPAQKVLAVLHNGTGKPSQGQGYMPVWEPLLKSTNSETQDLVDLRLRNLTEYVRTLQARPVTFPGRRIQLLRRAS
jgi:mono/diheme cytochrome c family protein